MIIASLSGGSVFNTKEIVSFNFIMKRDKKGKIYKRNGNYVVDKTKIGILFKNGVGIELNHTSVEDGEKMFNIILEAMREDNKQDK